MRLSVTFDTRTSERLERLASDDEGKAEAIRGALALEALYRDVLAKGGRMFIERADGSIAEVVRR